MAPGNTWGRNHRETPRYIFPAEPSLFLLRPVLHGPSSYVAGHRIWNTLVLTIDYHVTSRPTVE